MDIKFACWELPPCLLRICRIWSRGFCVATWVLVDLYVIKIYTKHTEVNVTHQLAHVLHAWSGCYIIKAVCSAAVFQPVWLRQADTSQRSIFTSVCAFCARTIIIITDTAGLLLPTIKCLWENSVQILDCKKSNLSRGSYHLSFNAVMATRPEGKNKKESTLFAKSSRKENIHLS